MLLPQMRSARGLVRRGLAGDVWHHRRDVADAPSVWEHRADRGELRTAYRRDDGALLVEGFVAREGILTYHRPDGSVFREYVPAKTLRDSMGQLGARTVTLHHPRADVDTRNVGQLRIGTSDMHVKEEQGGFIKVSMVVDRHDGIEAIEQGTQELSPGYVTRLDHTPGQNQYGVYDAIQVERRYNHIAVVDQARGGPPIRLRLDGIDAEPRCHPMATTVIRFDADAEAGRTDSPPKEAKMALSAVMAAIAARVGTRHRFDSDESAGDAIIRRLDEMEKEDEAEEAFFKLDEDSETEEDSDTGGFCNKKGDVTSSLF